MEYFPKIISIEKDKFAVYDSDGDGDSIVLLHGFAGDSRNFDHLLPSFDSKYRVIRVDLPGHGKSIVSDENYRMEIIVDRLSVLFNRLQLKNPVLLGYSMGARVALQFAVRHHSLLKALIIESGTYGIPDELEAKKRRQLDNNLSYLIENDFQQFLTEWPHKEVFSSPIKIQPELLHKIEHIRKAQNPLGLSKALRGFGTGSMKSVKEKLGEIRCPVLILTGEADKKFSQIGNEIHGLLPNSKHLIFPKSGHRIHLERPELYLTEVKQFIQHYSS